MQKGFFDVEKKIKRWNLTHNLLSQKLRIIFLSYSLLLIIIYNTGKKNDSAIRC